MFLNATIFILDSKFKHLDITYFLEYFNDNTVKQFDSTKFLGCFIDSKLNWHTFIENVALKMCKDTALVRNEYNVPVYIRRMIYLTYIYIYS